MVGSPGVSLSSSGTVLSLALRCLGEPLPDRQMEGELLDEALEFRLAGAAPGLAHDRPERVHHDDARADQLDLHDDLPQDHVQVPSPGQRG